MKGEKGGGMETVAVREQSELEKGKEGGGLLSKMRLFKFHR